MFFKSLELQGFKSFPDRVKLEFEQGLTAVVGPNGSGKSNIGDAIRWVLGEQSTKLLRGNRMEDVIFSGTKRRKPSGFAAVTIQLDNQTGLFGESYGETIAITRKLYRSGESVYQINGKAVRLKDVQELLMDTGMGRDGYAIIGQGRIAEIVSARSTDRRELFEEATGVSKFRYKREEAERNLQAAQENLVRLQDIAATLEGRVEPLRQQAEVAKQFLKLSEQQKKLELSLWMQQLTGLDQEKAALRDTLLQARGNEQNAALDLKQADALLQEQYREMQQTTVRIQNLRESVQQAEETAAQTQADLAVCANEQQHNEQPDGRPAYLGRYEERPAGAVVPRGTDARFRPQHAGCRGRHHRPRRLEARHGALRLGGLHRAEGWNAGPAPHVPRPARQDLFLERDRYGDRLAE